MCIHVNICVYIYVYIYISLNIWIITVYGNLEAKGPDNFSMCEFPKSWGYPEIIQSTMT